MAGDMNHWSGVGRLTKDPDLRSTQTGSSVANFSIAVNYIYSASGEKKETTSFFNCVAWGKPGEAIAQYCKKGHRIGIEGRLQQRTWDDPNGNKRSTVEVVVEKFQFLQAKQGGASDTPPEQSPGTGPDTGESYVENPFSDEEIQF